MTWLTRIRSNDSRSEVVAEDRAQPYVEATALRVLHRDRAEIHTGRVPAGGHVAGEMPPIATSDVEHAPSGTASQLRLELRRRVGKHAGDHQQDATHDPTSERPLSALGAAPVGGVVRGVVPSECPFGRADGQDSRSAAIAPSEHKRARETQLAIAARIRIHHGRAAQRAAGHALNGDADVLPP